MLDGIPADESCIMPYPSPSLNHFRHVGPIPFPREAAQAMPATRSWNIAHENASRLALSDRRMHVLAQELACLGYFDHDPNRPDAA
ncbi:MAG: hypothetical protein CMJ39_12345 [Phycisphaerae bacterium]|nr:hypothetical protein [Phycisphaerae bacterium]